MTSRCHRHVRCRVCICMLAAVAVLHADAASGAGMTGHETPKFPNAAAALESLGYAADDYTVLLTWNEVARHGEGPLVIGHRVAAADGGRGTFDLYTDVNGAPLDAATLAALGIRPKVWDRPPVTHDAEQSVTVPKEAGPPPEPVSASAGAGPTVLVALPAVDLEQILGEDARGESTAEKGVMRIGVFQELEQPVVVTAHNATHGVWETLDDGSQLWAATIYSPDAVGQRVHFRVLAVPAGARVVVYNVADPGEAYGPYQAPASAEPDLWSATCFSDAVTVECFVPAGTDPQGLRLEIDRTIHIYREFGRWPWLKAAGYCNLDVACDEEWPEEVAYTAADWSTTALGIGGIGTIGHSGYLWCTGTLVADLDPTSTIPYFWTANHCVEGQGEAESIEVYWRYQRDGCGGTVPNVRTVPRTTGGADYLAGAVYPSGTDFTLLRLRDDPPAGLTYVGWSVGPPKIGTDITCVHHPSGDYKRIAFGTLTDGADPCFSAAPPGTLFHQATWYAGTTEAGSSGSPLMVASTQRIIGQLYGGYASCSTPQCPDYFGRFDVTFPIVESWLAPDHDPLDIDYSGTVDAADIQKVVNAALGMDVAPYHADVDGSGSVDAVDVQLLIIAVLD